MPRLRNADDQVVDVDEKDVRYYTANGWSVDNAATSLDAFKREVASPADTGLVGQLGAAATSLASGASLGLSDILTGQLATDATIDQVNAEKLANPVTSTLGTIAGAVVPALAAPGSLLSRTPAGALSRASAAATEAAPLAARLGAFGVEGAAQNVGAYLGEVSLSDKQLSAEALAAAAGSGFAVGAAGGAAALGIERGTIAARKLFARSAEGGERAVSEAKAAWERARSEAVDAHEQAATLARSRLDEARAAREGADLAKRQAAAKIAEEKAALARELPNEKTGVPSFDDIDQELAGSDVADVARVVTPGEMLERGWYEPRGPFQDPAALANARAALERGYTPTVRAGISPSGKVVVFSEAAELRAAVEAGRRVKVRWSTAFEPAADDVLRGAAAKAEVDALEAMKARIAAREIPDELGPFTDAGLEAAAQRELARQPKRVVAPEAEQKLTEALTEFDQAKAALDAMKESIAAGQVPDELGPFQPRGLEAAAQRELARRAAAPAATPAPARARRPVKVSASGSLEEQLAAMKARLDEGASLTDLNAEAAVAKADAPTFVDEVAQEAELLSRYESAAAKVADALGDEAPSAARTLADGLRTAEAKADERLLNQTVRAVDDVERVAAPSASERLKKAKLELVDADVALARAKASEAQAASASRAAKGKAGQARKEFDAANPQPIEDFTDPGLDGIPGVSHIPVVGPLLNAWMRARTAAAIAGRMTGRIPATGTSKIAALAARTKNRVARAVDRSLGIVEAGARAAQPIAARATVAVTREALAKRAFDDGEQDAPDGATLTRLAAVRVREVTAAAAQPERVAAQVRRELRDVDDPDVVEAAVRHQIAKYQHLAQVCPKSPPPNPFSYRDWEPSPALSMQFARRLDAADNPESVLDDLAHQCLAPESADTLRVVYPRIFEMARQRLMERAGDLDAPLSYAQRVRNSLMFQLPLDSSMEPDGILELQAVHSPIQEQQTPAASTPSISSSVDLMSLQQTGLDRRAMR